MYSLYNKAFYFISGHGRGWAFSANDLLAKFSRQQADNILSDLLKDGKIRRVCRGIYDYPKYSEFLKQDLSPDIDQVARAFARKFNWRIEVLGDTALNLKTLGKERVTEEVIETIRKRIEPKMYAKILKDTQSSTVWIYEAIKQICREG